MINCIFVLFIVESPRWLYAQGRRDEAIAIFAKYHSRDGSIDSPVVKLEMQEIETSISLTGGDKQFWNFKKVFDSRSNRYRFGLCAMISCWGQLAGNGMITCTFVESYSADWRFLAAASWTGWYRQSRQTAPAEPGEQCDVDARRIDG